MTTTNLDIYPAIPSGQSDSWNTGLLETNINGPLISNVTINLPGWGNLPDPGGYQCTVSGKPTPCAIHSLPSPANPVAMPPNLGFGTATGVAIQGSGAGNFAIDSVIVGLTVSGGLVGLDLAQFRGAYVSDSKFAAEVYGIRADSWGTISELLSVTNSLFSTTTAGVYSNGIGGMQVTGNYLQPADVLTPGLPSWTAIWARNDNNDTLTGNNILGGGPGAVVPEYGVFHSSNGMNGFPVSITGNTFFNFNSPGSVCLGNDANMQSIIATGNSLYNCSTYLADAQGGNGYGGNMFQTPDFYDNGKDNVSFPNSLTIGTIASSGSLQVVDRGLTTFYLGSNGSISTKGAVAAQGAVTSNASVTGASVVSNGPIVMAGNPGHYAAQQVVGNFYFPNGSNPSTITLNPPSGGFPPFTAGLATIFGELTCSGNNSTVISWHVDGHYTMQGSTLVPGTFAATLENDAESQATAKSLGGTNTITPIANPNALGLQVSFGTGIINVFDCTSVLTAMVEN